MNLNSIKNICKYNVVSAFTNDKDLNIKLQYCLGIHHICNDAIENTFFKEGNIKIAL